MTITRETILRRSGSILYAQVGADEGVMLSVEQGLYYGLNAVAARICELLETPTTVAEVIARVCDEFDVDPETAETEVIKFVTALADNGIVHQGASAAADSSSAG